MGGSQTKRRVVVEDANGEGVVQITEAVVRRVKGLPEAPVQESSKQPQKQVKLPDSPKASDDTKHQQNMSKEIEDFYMEKLTDLQKRSQALQQHSNEQFAKAVKEVEQKFMKYTSSPVCQDLQTKVLECYQTNPHTVLDCSPLVAAFSTCVDRARMTVSQNRPHNSPQEVQPVS